MTTFKSGLELTHRGTVLQLVRNADISLSNISFFLILANDRAVGGCLQPLPAPIFDRLSDSDGGGQYNSQVGSNQGQPPESFCVGFKHYTEVSL